jgi:cell division protein FtsQ
MAKTGRTKKRQAARSVAKRDEQNQWREKAISVIKNTWLHRVTALSLICIPAWFAYQNLQTIDVLPIASVSIEGEFKYLSQKNLQQHALPYVTGGFFSVDLKKIRQVLLTVPWVEDVSVRRQWPDSLSLRVIEKQPVAYWGKNKLLSSRGDLFEPENIKINILLPELAGPENQHAMMLQELGRLQAWLIDTGLVIKKINQDARRSWTLYMVSGMELRLGRKNMHERLHRFVDAYSQQLSKQITNTKSGMIKHVDMRYTNGFAVAWGQEA